MNKYLEIAQEVRRALASRCAIIALESTIISHGMPYPENVHTALRIEEIVRDAGAVPATIAILNGKMKVGLSADEITLLGRNQSIVTKTSKRDIPLLLYQNQPGSTTVAATLAIAQRAGIHFLATGGIGGVHRGASETFDISADLMELESAKVAVFCAGVKSILDIGLTIEYLETLGVPVLGFGTNEFPAFYSRRSGFFIETAVNSCTEAASIIKTKWDAGFEGGVLIACPIPEDCEPNAEIIQTAIEEAIRMAAKNNIKGKDITPFLLARTEELSGGISLKANIELVKNNARIASKTAVEYYTL
jgi:pseudouridine-5'-phosphate glycosidase